MSRINDIWRRMQEEEDDEPTPSWVHPVEPQQPKRRHVQFSSNIQDVPVNVAPAHRRRTLNIHPDGVQEATEDYVESTIPFAQHQLDLQYARQQNDYNLGVQQMEYQFRDRQAEREHQETMKEIDQRPVEAEIQLREQQQKFEQELFHANQRARLAREGKLFQQNLMSNGMTVMQQRQDLFELFGFTRADANNIDAPRLSDPVVLLSRVGNNSCYVHSLLATGVDSINENPFNCYIRFVDGTRMNLPNGRNGYKCTFRRFASGFYIIHVSRYSSRYMREKYRPQYLQSLICCNDQCSVH